MNNHDECWECGLKGDLHSHHVVPKSRGGTKTIPLCVACHSLAHHKKKNMASSTLIRESIRRKIANGEPWGGNAQHMRQMAENSVAVRSRNADTFALTILIQCDRLEQSGINTLSGKVKMLNKLNITTRTGKPWNCSGLHRVIKRARQYKNSTNSC